MTEAVAADTKRDRGRRLLAAMEFALVFFGLPLAYRLELIDLHMLPTLWLAALVALAVLWFDPTFDRRRLWRAGAVREFRPGRSLAIFVAAAAGMLAVTGWLQPDLIFGFPRTHGRWWLLVMVLYPLLSVYPQELLYRAFLFHRGRDLFPSPVARIWASAFAFAFLHLVFRNWVAVLLTLPAGWLFARTYERSGSLFWTSAEHALYGDWVFTVGLGIYFYGGTIAATGG